jgi:hypothetical protein
MVVSLDGADRGSLIRLVSELDALGQDEDRT